MLTVTRYHDISCGHRVAGHEGKCRSLHGHNYRVHFTCSAPQLDSLGRVVDFGVIKSRLCQWLELEWDHKFLLWDEDPLRQILMGVFSEQRKSGPREAQLISDLLGSFVTVPFNPTAENMADYLLRTIGPMALRTTGVDLVKVTIEETMKCSATASL